MNQETIKILRDLAVELAQMSNRIYEIGTGDGMAAEGLEPPKDAPARPEPKFKVGDAFVDTLDPKRIFIIAEPPRWTGKDGWRYRGVDSLNGDDHWIERMLGNSRIRLPVPPRPDQHSARLTGEVRLPEMWEWYVTRNGETVQLTDNAAGVCTTWLGGRRWICKPPVEEPKHNCGTCRNGNDKADSDACPLCMPFIDYPHWRPKVPAPATHTCPQAEWDVLMAMRTECEVFVAGDRHWSTHQNELTAILERLKGVKGGRPCKQ